MISNLKETTQQNRQQDWLKSNLAKFTEMMQGQRSIKAVAQLIMSELTPLIEARYGTFYSMDLSKSEPVLHLIASYAINPDDNVALDIHLKEGLVGQCAFEKKRILISPPANYLQVRSSLGHAKGRGSAQEIIVTNWLPERKQAA
jgi:hypothetical protein